MTNAANYDFSTMTTAQALDILVELEVARWGEEERTASREAFSRYSHGLMVNALVHHFGHDYGAVFTAKQKKAAKELLTKDDKKSLKKGG